MCALKVIGDKLCFGFEDGTVEIQDLKLNTREFKIQAKGEGGVSDVVYYEFNDKVLVAVMQERMQVLGP